jgi:ribonuclease J
MYATKFTCEIIRNKLKETTFQKAPLIEIPLSGKVSLSPFDIEFITLTHSIPEPSALAITTPHGVVMHTGDWKIDPAPLVGNVTDEKRLKEYGDKGILALVCDSTNAFQEGTSGSEGDMRTNLIEVIKAYPKQRVTVACFASNVARLESAAVAAKETGRQVVLIGRSLLKMEQAARAAGYLKHISAFLSDRDAKHLPPERTLLICTGSQGEAKAVLSKITNEMHPTIKFDAGDVVIFSARTIPGNERHVGPLQNKLTRKGVKIVTANEEDIHVSGHPYRDELKQMYEWTRPKILVPVHGEARHLYEHRNFGLQCGIPHAVIPNNGTLIRLAPGRAEIVDANIPVGRLTKDGDRLISVDSMILKERQRLSVNGSLFMTLILGKKGLKDAHFSIQGIVESGEETQKLESELRGIISDILKQDHASEKSIKEKIFQAVRNRTNTLYGKKPVTEIHIVKG